MDAVEVDGLPIAYRRAGNGPALLLVHGALGDSRDWRRQLEGSATSSPWSPGTRRVGGGRTTRPSGSGCRTFADRLAGFAAAVGLERPHVLGLSFGGGLALELYRRHPGLPRSLVLASAYAGWAGSLPAEVVRERVERADREAGLPPEQWVRGYLIGLFTESAPPELLEEAAVIMLEVRPAGLRSMTRSFAQADLREVLPGIGVPTLLVYGDADRRSPLGTVAAELHETIPGSRLRVMPGVGHAANMEAPERFNAEVREFLRSVP